MASKPRNGEALCKTAAGIEGVGNITERSLSKNRTTIWPGGPNCDKPVLAHDARALGSDVLNHTDTALNALGLSPAIAIAHPT